MFSFRLSSVSLSSGREWWGIGMTLQDTLDEGKPLRFLCPKSGSLKTFDPVRVPWAVPSTPGLQSLPPSLVLKIESHQQGLPACVLGA